MFAALAHQSLRLPQDRIMQSVASSPAPRQPRWIASLSLGPSTHHSTLALLCKQEVSDNGQRVQVYDCPFLKRYELGTSYNAIVGDLRDLLADPRLEKATLVLERTVVGLPLLQLFRGLKARVVPVSLARSALKHEPDGLGGWLVPKMDLTGLMQRLLSGRRPGSAGLPLFACAGALGDTAQQLEQEWGSFTAKIQTAADTPFVWRETANEDLCLAVACGCWAGEYVMRRLVMAV